MLSRTVRSYRSLLFKFWTPRVLSPLLEFRYNVRCSSWAHWKVRSALPISVNWTFFGRCYGWGAIRAKIDRKSAISLQRGRFDTKFQVEGVDPTNHFCTDSLAHTCFTTLSLTVFIQRNFVADSLQAKCDFRRKTAVLRFEPLWRLRGNVRWSW